MTEAGAGNQTAQVPTTQGGYWGWLPTHRGAISRDSVTSMWVERVDGQFKNGATSSWTVVVTTFGNDEPVTLRPLFFDAELLMSFVDQTFPGACFSLLPPGPIAEVLPESQAPENVRAISGADMAEIIRTIGSGWAGETPTSHSAGSAEGAVVTTASRPWVESGTQSPPHTGPTATKPAMTWRRACVDRLGGSRVQRAR